MLFFAYIVVAFLIWTYGCEEYSLEKALTIALLWPVFLVVVVLKEAINIITGIVFR